MKQHIFEWMFSPNCDLHKFLFIKISEGYHIDHVIPTISSMEDARGLQPICVTVICSKS